MYKKIQLFLIMFVSSSLYALDNQPPRYEQTVEVDQRLVQIRDRDARLITHLQRQRQIVVAGAIVSLGGAFLSGLACSLPCVPGNACEDKSSIFYHEGKIFLGSLASSAFFLNQIWTIDDISEKLSKEI
jgi:hypothetical protein